MEQPFNIVEHLQKLENANKRLNSLVGEKEKLENDIYKLRYDEAYRNALNEKFKAIVPLYQITGVSVYKYDKDTIWQELPIGTEVIKLQATLTNRGEYDKFKAEFGSCNSPEEYLSSVEYAVINNVLVSIGGGNCMLKEFSIVTPDEWEGMKSGIIPERISNGRKFISAIATNPFISKLSK